MFPDALPQLIETPPDTNCDDFSLTVSDEEDTADVPPEVEWARPDRTREEKRPEPQRVGWASKRLLIGTLFLGSLFAGLQIFGANSAVPPVARQKSREDNASGPTGALALPAVLVPIDIAKQFDDVVNAIGQNAQPAVPVVVLPVAIPPPAPGAAKAPVTAKAPVIAKAPVMAKAPAPARDARPKSKASLYDRVRQVVLENKTEETTRLGMGDIAYQDVPDDGSIMVGMEVTYAPFFTHQIIKSVRPIYQNANGQRYGPVCGTPTGVGERVVAKEGYAIGGAAIKSGMGIDGMQLTFMEIGADGLNPNKTYLSKWLGGYGGSGAQMFVNDGRPIIGIAGMRSTNPNGPAFCMCLVTIPKEEEIANAGGPRLPSSR